jgi:hypothetical protein
MANPTSQALKAQRRPVGNQWRHGDHKDIMDNIYTNMDAAFNALEAAINAGWSSCIAAYDVNVPAIATADITPDGTIVPLVAGDRVLLPNQTNPEENGIYVVGVVTGTCVLSRATDLNELSEIQLGDSVWVHGTGATLSNTEWRVTQVPVALGGVPNVGNANDFLFEKMSIGTAFPISTFAAVGDLAVGTGASTAAAVTITANSIVARLNAGSVVPVTVATNTMVARAAGDIDDIAISASQFVGRTSASNLKGMTAAESRLILDSPVAGIPTALPDSGSTLSAAQLVNGVFTIAALTDPEDLTLTTATLIAAALANAAAGMYVDFVVINNSISTASMVMDGSITHLGAADALLIPPGTQATFRIALLAGLVTANFWRLSAADTSASTGMRSVMVEVDFSDIAAAGVAVELGPTFPIGTRVLRSYYHVDIQFTDGAADTTEIGLGFNTDDANGILASATVGAASAYDASAIPVTGIQTGAFASMSTILTAARRLEITRAGVVAALTAGHMFVYLDYVVSPA